MRLTRIEVDGESRDIPSVWSMSLPEAHLLFVLTVPESPSDDDRGHYSVYALEAGRQPDPSFWDGTAIEGMEPAGEIPAADVERDEQTGGFRLRTMGIERFAAPTI